MEGAYLLWGRGATSFNRIVPSRQRNISTLHDDQSQKAGICTKQLGRARPNIWLEQHAGNAGTQRRAGANRCRHTTESMRKWMQAHKRELVQMDAGTPLKADAYESWGQTNSAMLA
eukprot:1158599-Pelagomonas_calceolata.AAC.15